MVDLPGNELGPLLPTYDDEELARLLGVAGDDRVLDVGGGAQPFRGADVVVELHLHDNVHRGGQRAAHDGARLVQASVEALPFADGAFDFVVCRHVLEHVDDPRAACRELSRVAARGYVETPSKTGELLHGYPNHLWLVTGQGGALRFEPKPFVRNPFRNVTRALHYASEEFREAFEGRYRNVFCTQLYWEGRLDAEVAPRAPDDFDYGDPVHACVAHLDYALNYVAYGLDQRVPAEVGEHLRRAAEIAGPGTLAAALLDAWRARERSGREAFLERVQRVRRLDLVEAVAGELRAPHAGGAAAGGRHGDDGTVTQQAPGGVARAPGSAADAPGAPPFVVTGCGRSGTGYASALLTALGAPCGHEQVFGPRTSRPRFDGLRGDASWLAVPFLADLPPGAAVLHQLRDPIEVVRSCVGIGLFAGASPYRAFLTRHCPEIFEHDGEVAQAMAYWVHWNQRVEALAADRPYLRYRLEDVDEGTLGRITELLGLAPERGVVAEAWRRVPRHLNHRARAGDVRWDRLPRGPLYDALVALARRYGYRVPGARRPAPARPAVTVVVRTFNRPEALQRCLAHLAHQRWDDFEVVVVADGGLPVDDVAAAFADHLALRLVTHEVNRGRAAAWNSGIAAARGRYACMVDDDDVAYAGHLATLVAAAERLGGRAVVYSDAFEAREAPDGTVAERVAAYRHDFDRERLAVHNFLPVLSVLFPLDAARAAGPVDEELDVLEDWDFWLRLSALRPFVRVAEVTCEYRLPARPSSSRTREVGAHLVTLAELYRRHPVAEGSAAAAERDRRLREARRLAAAAPPVRHSVVVAAGDDEDELAALLRAVARAFERTAHEVVVHAPRALAGSRVLAAVAAADGVVLLGDGDREEAWKRGRRRAAGRVCLLADPGDAGRIDAGTPALLDERPDGSVVRAADLPPAPEGAAGGRAPRCTIVMPLYNRAEYTERCLVHLAAHTDEALYEAVLVDNGSTDGTPLLLECVEGDVRIVRNERNRGFAAACNQGARLARTDALLFLNNDTEPLPGWLEPLLAALDADERVGAVGARLLFPDGSLQHAGVALVEDRRRGVPIEGRHRFYRMPGDLPEANVPGDVRAVTAAAMLVRRSAFEEVGGFDEGYWNGNEDVDLCLALRERGWRVVYEPRSCLLHHESVSGQERFRRASDNVARLNRRWAGKVTPDAVITAEGRMHGGGVALRA